MIKSYGSQRIQAIPCQRFGIQLKGSHDCAYLPLHVLVGDPPRHLTRKGSDSIWQGALKEEDSQSQGRRSLEVRYLAVPTSCCSTAGFME